MRNNYLLEDLRSQLLRSALWYLEAWLPGGRTCGREYIVRNPTRSDQHIGSFKVNILTGKWADFATGDSGGDFISLYVYIHRTSYSQAIRELQSEVNGCSPLPAPCQVIRNEEAGTKEDWISRILDRAYPVSGTIAEEYLNARAIHLYPNEIFFNSSLYHSPTERFFPALLSPLKYPGTKEVVGLHRTYLDPFEPKKADATPNRMMRGKVKGAGTSLFHEEMPSEIAVCEGLETGLSLYQDGLSVVCALSASNLPSIDFGNCHGLTSIILALDHDEAGLTAGAKGMRAYTEQGFKTRILLPPEGMDFNDLAMRKERHDPSDDAN